MLASSFAKTPRHLVGICPVEADDVANGQPGPSQVTMCATFEMHATHFFWWHPPSLMISSVQKD